MSSLREKKLKAELAARGKSSSRKSESQLKKESAQARIKKAEKKVKSKAKHEEKELSQISKEEERQEKFTHDSDTRQIIRNRLLRTLASMRSQQREINNEEVQVIAQHLAYEMPFSPDEIKQLEINSDLENISYPQPVTDPDTEKVSFVSTPINIISSLKLYSRLLNRLSYTPLRSRILQQVDVFSRLRDRPIFLEDLLYRDEIVPQDQVEQLRYEYELPTAILNEIGKYNQILLSGPHKPLPSSSQIVVITGPPRTIEEETVKTLKDLQKDRSVILSRIEEKASETEEIEVEKERVQQPKTKITTEENAMIAATRQIRIFRNETRQAISEEKHIEPEDVTEEEIDNYLLQAENLPAWTFLAQFASSPISDSHTRELLRQISGLDQFGRIFIRLHNTDQANFTRQIFAEFPIESWPLGPPVSLLSKLTEYYNRVASAAPTDQELDNRLATTLSSDFIILFKSLQPGQQLHYREIIFARLSEFNKKTVRSILNMYEGYLENPAAKLVFDENVMIKYTSTASNTTLSRSPVRLDFILPWNNTTREEIKAWIENLLSPQFLSVLVSSGSNAKYLQSSISEKVLSLMKEYFKSILPSIKDFVDLVSDTVLHKIQEYLAVPSSPIQNIQNFPIELPESVVQSLTSRLQTKRKAERLSWTVEELQQQAYRLGLNLADNIEQAAAESKSRLDDQLRLGEITPDIHTQKLEEIDNFVNAYLTLNRNIAPKSSVLKHRQKQFQTFYQDRLDALSSELTERLDRLTKQIWKEVIRETGLRDEVKQLRSFINSRIIDLKEAASESGENPTTQDLENEAWKDAEDEDIASESKLELIRSAYDRFKSEHEEELQNKGILLTTQGISDKAWADAIQAGILSPEEVGRITAQQMGERGLARRLAKTITRKAKTELRKTVSNMPEALRKSLAQLMDNITSRMDQVEATKRDEMASYFKFLGSVMLASWNAKKEGKNVQPLLENIVEEFSSKIPASFIKKILEIIRESQISGRVLSWNDLLTFTNNYTQQTVMLIRNPLVRQTERRRRRYDRLFEQSISTGEINNLRRQLPPLDPHLKECITAHQLKPWLNIPHIQKWKLFIADPSGKSRSEMEPSARAYFNLTREQQFIVRLETGKKLYFYKPTTAYWTSHCQLYHSASDPQVCDAKLLKKAFSGKKAKFYELLVKFPLPNLELKSSGEIVYNYKNDTKNIIFLSMDPKVYDLECRWFKSRYQGIEERLNNLRLSPVSSVPNSRKYAAWELRQSLALLRIKYGDSTISEQTLSQVGLGEGGVLARGDISISADLLERAVYSSATGKKGSHVDVYSYFRILHSLLLFLSVTDPVTKHAAFFQGLAAQCANAYFPTLLRDFATPQQRFPELFLLPGSSSTDLLKEKVQQYLEQTTHILTERALLRELALDMSESAVEPLFATLNEQEIQTKSLGNSENKLDAKLSAIIKSTEQATSDYALSIGSLFTSDSLKLVAKVPQLTLKNVCVNSSDYKDLDDSWLVYYTHKDQVYCISKLQLAGMAQAKTYSFQGVEFDHKFVDGFSSYTDFAASELSRRTEYIETVTKALINLPENSDLFQNLVSQKNIIGTLDPEDVGNVLQQLSGIGKIGNKLLQRDDAYLISLVQQKLDDIVDAYISKHIMELAETFIDENRDKLISELRSSYETFRKVDVLAPVHPIHAERDTRKLVLAPLVGIIQDHIEQTSQFFLTTQHRQAISSLIDRKISTSKEVGPEIKQSAMEKEKCAACQAELTRMNRVPYRSASQQRQGLETRTNYLAFCSQACFGKHKVSELSEEDVEVGRLQNAVNQLTKQTIDYTQMTLLARFPPSWKLPADSEKRRTLLSRWAKIRNLDSQEVQQLIQTLSLSENYLGISTRTPSGQELSQAELWDRIRTHPLFVPNINTLLEPENYEALQTLANAFGIVMYNGEDWSEFYQSEPEELRNTWKQLRSKPAFIKLLFSTVKTFDPYQELTIIDPRLEAIEDVNELWKSVENFCRQKLEDVADLHPQLFSDPERIKDIRKELLTAVTDKFLSLPLRLDLKKVYRMFTLQKTLRVWFVSHKDNLLQGIPVSSSIPENKNKGVIGSSRMIRELHNLCGKRMTANELSIWTAEIIRTHKDKVGNSAPDQTRFATDFWPRLKTHFNCSGIERLEKDYSEYVFNLEKVNKTIDEQMAEVMEERQQATLPVPISKPGKGRKLPARAKLPRADEPSLAQLLDRANSEELVASHSLVNIEPQVKTRLEILAKIQELRHAETKKIREDRKAGKKQKLKEEKPAWISQAVLDNEPKAVQKEEKEQAAELRQLLAAANLALSVHDGNVVKAIEALEKRDLSQVPDIMEEIGQEEFVDEEPEIEMEEHDEEPEEEEYGEEPEEEY